MVIIYLTLSFRLWRHKNHISLKKSFFFLTSVYSISDVFKLRPISFPSQLLYVLHRDYMDEPQAHSISEELDENGNKFINNKVKDFDRFCKEVLEAIFYLRSKAQVLIGKFW